MQHRCAHRWVVFFGSGLFAAAACGQTIEVDAVVFPGDDAPGLGQPAQFEEIHPGPAYPQGRGVFRARAGAIYGLWTGAPGDFALVAAGDRQAPDTEPDTVFANNSANFSRFGAVVGDVVAFWARLEGPSVTDDNDTGIWIYDGAVCRKLIREGDAVPNLAPGTTFSDISHNAFQNVMSAAGSTLFYAVIEGPGVNSSNNWFLYAGHPDGSVTTVFRKGDPAPGTDLDFTGGGGFLLNDNDYCAHRALIGPEQLPAIFAGPLDGLQHILSEGDVVPGFEHLDLIEVMTASLNNGPTLVIRGTFHDPNAGGYVHALWRHTPASGMDLVVASGDPAPGIDADAYFFAFHSAVLDASGRLVFGASLSGDVSGDDNDGLWSLTEDRTWELILRSNDSIPGYPHPITFSASQIKPAVDDNGLTIFKIDGYYDLGPLGHFDSAGVFSFLKSGDQVAIDPWKYVTVVSAGLDNVPSGSHDGRCTALDVNGYLVAFLNGDAACTADLNGDGSTDQADLGILLQYYGNDVFGDLDGDDDTDQADLGILLSDYGCEGESILGLVRVTVSP